MKSNHSFDTLIVGGGLVGAAIACGIAATGSKVRSLMVEIEIFAPHAVISG